MPQTLKHMIQNLTSKLSRKGAKKAEATAEAFENFGAHHDSGTLDSTHPGVDSHVHATSANNNNNNNDNNGMPREIDISLETRTGVKIATPPPPSVNEFFNTAAPSPAKANAPQAKPTPTASAQIYAASTTNTGHRAIRPLPKAETIGRHEVGGAAVSQNEFGESETETPQGRKLGVDLAIVAVAIIALGGSAFFFFGDSFFSGGNQGQLTVVGKISKSHSDVRRKVDGGLSWGTVASADKVYEGDSIFTGDGSDALIQLDKGGQIAVDPKSLIVIRTKGNKLEVDLQYGSLEGHIENNQPLLLKQGSEVKTIEGTNAQIRIVRAEKSHKTSIQVVSGQLKVQGKTIEKNEVLELEKDQAPVITKVQLSLVSPKTGKTLWLAMGKTVDFTWSTGKPDAQYVVELSKTTSFEHPVYNATVQGTTYQLAEESRPAGEFYWRVRPAKDGLPSLPARLTVYNDLPPKLVSPTDAYSFTLPPDSPQVEVPLVWEDNAGSMSFHLQVASDPEFKSIIADETSTVQRFKTKGLATGHYSWRVMGLNPDRVEAHWSRTQSFAVDATAPPLSVPAISQNDWHYEIPDRSLKGLLGPVPDDQGVEAKDLQPLAWPAARGATGYQVEVANNSEFKNASLHDVSEPSFLPEQVHPGTAFVRVRSKDVGGHLSDRSEPAKLVITVAAPKLKAPKSQIAKFENDETAATSRVKHEFKLEWTPQVFADQYEVEWGADREFTRSKTFKVKANEKQISVSHPMAYAARVRALDKSGQPISPYSKAVTAELRKVVAAPLKILPKREVAAIQPKPLVLPQPIAQAAPPLGGLALPRITAPILREPQPQSSLISLESSPTYVDFKWKPIKGAAFYVLEIAQDADFQSKIAQIKVQGTSFVFQKPLPEGHVFWRVRYRKGSAQSDWSDVSDLNVIYQ